MYNYLFLCKISLRGLIMDNELKKDIEEMKESIKRIQEQIDILWPVSAAPDKTFVEQMEQLRYGHTLDQHSQEMNEALKRFYTR